MFISQCQIEVVTNQPISHPAGFTRTNYSENDQLLPADGLPISRTLIRNHPTSFVAC
jgi:hypothetical protein